MPADRPGRPGQRPALRQREEAGRACRRRGAAPARRAGQAHGPGMGGPVRRRGALRGGAQGRGHVRSPAGDGRADRRRLRARRHRPLPRGAAVDRVRPYAGARALRGAGAGPAQRRAGRACWRA